MKKNYVDFIKNISFSFFAYALPTAILQFLVQPIIAKKIGADENGQYLTLMSLNYFLIGITATVLNTVRLLQDKNYKERHLSGDFNLILVGYLIVLAVVMPCGMVFYTKEFDALDIVLFLIIGILYLYHDYVFAQYRLKLQYNKILMNNLIAVLGYGIGILLFLWVGKWQVVYISAYVLTTVYDYLNTDFIKEPVKKTPLMRETIGLLITFTVSSILTSSVTYFDKLLLYPILGGESVSIYNTASLVGKMLLMISAPLSSVFLSYLVQENRLSIQLKYKHYLGILLFMVAGYLACTIVGYPITALLYPDWAQESQALIPLTVAASLLLLFGSCINTVLVRFFKSYLQILVQIVHLLTYLSLSMIGLKLWGLKGFCIGVLVSNFIRMLMIVLNIAIRPKRLLKTGI